MEVPVYNNRGEQIKIIEVDDYVFNVPFNGPVVHQALVMHNANARVGTASTKTRGEVAGSTRKIRPQKYTGMARLGDRRSPLLRGGGVAFGPKPRDWSQRMPKKMRRLAIRCTLSAKLRDGELKIIDTFGLERPKTKEMAEILKALGVEKSALLVTRDPEPAVYLSARNLQKVKTIPAHIVNVKDLLSHRMVIMTEGAVRKVEELWGRKADEERAERLRRKKAKAKAKL